jgi:hypothetical protein
MNPIAKLLGIVRFDNCVVLSLTAICAEGQLLILQDVCVLQGPMIMGPMRESFAYGGFVIVDSLINVMAIRHRP